MPRGGSRRGKAGAAYSSRTDLMEKPRLPVTTVPGQPYGAAKAQADAQAAVPMGSPALPDMPDLSDHPHPLPGELPPLTGPSNMPGQPVTHGLPVGPGAGPEALTGIGAPLSPLTQGVAILNSLGKHLPPELSSVVKYLNVTQNNGQGQ